MDFLWLRNPQNPSSEFVMHRFREELFGAVCSTVMLNATHHCHLAQNESPTSKNLLNNLYFDNICEPLSENPPF